MQVKFLFKHIQTWCTNQRHGVATTITIASYISPLYLGSVSDPQLTRDCGYLKKLEGMSGAAIMADRGFTINDSLKTLGIELNLPPFMEGRHQLPADEIQRGRSIASLRIHVERAIGRMKLHKILTGVFPLKMARLANQIVVVCAYLCMCISFQFPPCSCPTSLLGQPRPKFR